MLLVISKQTKKLHSFDDVDFRDLQLFMHDYEGVNERSIQEVGKQSCLSQIRILSTMSMYRA
jgi:hypothetical protein